MTQYLTTFSDIFKNSFLADNAASTLTVPKALLILAVSLVLGAVLCLVYKITYRGVLFSASFCLSLLAIQLITTLIIMTVTSNVILSLGMVGALSIVRFRTAIKDPMDIAFLYFAICIGIMTGAGLLWLAVIGIIVVGVILIAAGKIPAKEASYILMVTVDEQDEEAVAKYVEKSTSRSSLKSKNITGGISELAFEVKLKGSSTKFLNKLSAYPTISSVTVVKASGEYI